MGAAKSLVYGMTGSDSVYSGVSVSEGDESASMGTSWRSELGLSVGKRSDKENGHGRVNEEEEDENDDSLDEHDDGDDQSTSTGAGPMDDWRDDVFKALSEIEDATSELEHMTQSLSVGRSAPEAEDDRMLKSDIVLSSSPSWLKQSAPVPTWRRPVVRLAVENVALTSLIKYDDYSNSERPIRLTENGKEMAPVRLEPSGMVVTEKGEKLKLRTKKTRKTERREYRAMSLDGENEMIRTTPQKPSLQNSILSLRMPRPPRDSSICSNCRAHMTEKDRRLCHYFNQYFCSRSECHVNHKSRIPARIVHFWDFKEYPVSVNAKVHLHDNKDLPVINIALENSELYQQQRSLNEIRLLRKQLSILGDFIRVCPRGEALMVQMGARIHLFQREKLHFYSFQDLSDLKSLRAFILGLISSFASHVKGCTTCREKGSVCDICESKTPIYPFQMDAIVTCPYCRGIFHKKCWKEADETECVKCLRIQDLYMARK